MTFLSGPNRYAWFYITIRILSLPLLVKEISSFRSQADWLFHSDGWHRQASLRAWGWSAESSSQIVLMLYCILLNTYDISWFRSQVKIGDFLPSRGLSESDREWLDRRRAFWRPSPCCLWPAPGPPGPEKN
jgi:hypothetical protein